MGSGSISELNVLGGISRFLEELGRRRVWRTAFTYAAVVFVLLQIGEIVLPAFGAPEWALRLLVIAGFLGFPLALALAWAFDLTPEGIQRTGPDSEDRVSASHLGTTAPRIALLVVTATTVLGVGWWAVQDTLQARGLGSPTGMPGMAEASRDPSPSIRALAVLPLKDFGDSDHGGFFASGLQRELVATLSGIAPLRVVSSDSSPTLDLDGMALSTIAGELGVDAVIEGSVFRDGNRVRVTVQLIHGPSDRHLWADSYEGSLDDAGELQRAIAAAIAVQVRDEVLSSSA